MHFRNRFEVALQNIIYQFARDGTFGTSDHRTTVGAYYSELFSVGVYPTKITGSLMATLNSLDTFGSIPYLCSCHKSSWIESLQKKVLRASREARELVSGLCSDCIQGAGGHAGKCRIPHT